MYPATAGFFTAVCRYKNKVLRQITKKTQPPVFTPGVELLVVWAAGVLAVRAFPSKWI